jgi:hypothetical protein
LCSTENCLGRCASCGQAGCTRCRTTHRLPSGQTITYCANCSWRHYWRLWWGLYA